MNNDKIMFEPNTGCHIWTGGINGRGRGQVRVGGTLHYVHRLAYAEAKGAVPAGMQVNHLCDEPLCVNPDHLYAGTQQENIADMDRRKRRANFKGEKNPKAKLTAADVAAIRSAAPYPGHKAALARQYGVTGTQISTITKGAQWQ